MGSIGTPELILILIVALLIFGPKKLPELGRSFGRFINEFKRASRDIQESIEKEIENVKAPIKEIKESAKIEQKKDDAS